MRLLPGLVAVAFPAVLLAQRPPVVERVQLLDGSARALRGEGAAPATIVVLAASTAGAVRDAGPLRAALAAHADRGLAAVVVLPVAPAGPPPELQGLDVCVDAASAVRRGYGLPGPDGSWLLLQGGSVRSLGVPANGIDAAVAEALDGTLDAAAEDELRRRRDALLESFDDTATEEARAEARWLVAQRSTDGVAWALAFLVDAELACDPAAATATLQRALAALAAAPRPLAHCCETVLCSRPLPPERAAAIATALQPVAAAHEDDLVVQLAFLRALVAAGRAREVARTAHRLARRVPRDPELALTFATILAGDDPAAVHKDLVARVLRETDVAGVAPRLVAATRYVVALRCDEEPGAAADIARTYVDDTMGRVVINNDAWYFMTEHGTRGRHDEFALALVERMLQQRSAMDYFEFDTAALAMFRNGRLREAVELQRTAIENGGKEQPAYRERLARYRAAAAAAPR